MKQLIIIFTKADDATRSYFSNFFSDFNSDSSYWVFDKSNEYLVFFIKDSITSEIEGINVYWNQYRTYVPWIFFHLGHNIIEQMDWIELKFDDFKIYTTGGDNLANAGDHHNQDGKYFSHLVAASKCFKEGKTNEMNSHFKAIETLLNN